MEINDDRCRHVIEIFQGEHFDGLELLDVRGIVRIMCQQFDLIEWIRAKHQCDQTNPVHVYKTYINQMQLVYFIIPAIQSHNNDPSFVRFFNPLTSKQQNQVILIKRTIGKCSSKTTKDNVDFRQIYEVYGCKEAEVIRVKNIYQMDSVSQQLNTMRKHQISVIYVEFQTHLNKHHNLYTQSKSSLRTSKISIKISEHISQPNQFKNNCFMKHICKILNISYNKLPHSHNLNPKSFNGSSFLVLDQGTAIPYLRSIVPHSDLNKKRFTFLFRQPYKLATIKQLQQLVLQYADIVFDKTIHQKKKQLNYASFTQKPPQNHFICSASNAFIPFLLSLLQKLGKQKVSEYLLRYINITNPSYEQYFRQKSNSQLYIKLSQQKADDIKRSLSILLNRLILQYSKQISAIASELSFIFEIVELLNKSILTRQFIQKLLQLFIHFGGLLPEVLLSADVWMKEIELDKAKYQAELDGRSEQINIEQSGYQYKLNGFIEAGRMTGLRGKLYPMLCNILNELNSTTNSQSFTFQQHYSITSNAFTIVAFDITSRTVRFFNHFTTPTFNILNFLYMTQAFQSIQVLSNQWVPYKLIYEKQTVFVNLYQAILTPPIGVDCLEQFTDNYQIRNMYFSFSHNNAETQLEFTKYVFDGKSVQHEVYQERQSQYSVKLHQIISSLKKLIFANIPKTKLIWRFIKFQVSNKQNLNDKPESVISILRKIQLVNHIYNMFKTMISHEKNLCREVWLLSQCNLLDCVKSSSRLNIIQKGEQQGVIQWQIERIKHLKRIVEQQLMIEVGENQKKLQKWVDILEQNLIGRVVNKSIWQDDILSVAEKMRIRQNIRQNISGCYNKLCIIESGFGDCKQIASLKAIFEQCLKHVQQLSTQDLNKIDSNQNLSIGNFTKYIAENIMRQKVWRIIKQNNVEVFQVIKRINQLQVRQVLKQVDKYIGIISSAGQALHNVKQDNGMEFSWFNTQLTYQKLIKSLFSKIYHSITIPIKPTLLKIFYHCGVKQIQVYDLFMSNFTLIQDKIDTSMFGLCDELGFSKELLTRNKINLVVDCEDGSELHTYLYLKLIFDKLQKVQTIQSNTLHKSALRINSCDFLNNKGQIIVDSAIPLGKYFQSFTCSGFQSIAILELILQNNFRNVQGRKTQRFHEILHEILSYRHLLQWNPSQQIDHNFAQFNWHHLQQDILEHFYQIVYTEDYLKQILSKSQLSNQNLKQAEKSFNEKLQQKSKNQPLFSKKRRQTSTYLFYEVLQQWCSNTLQRKNKPNQNLVQNDELLNDLINSKILYNQSVINTYSVLQKKQLVSIVKNFMQKFAPFFEEFISAALDTNPHSKHEWKGVLLKNAISSFRLKIYIQKLLQSYNLNVGLTFLELYSLGKNKFQGAFNILLWNTSKSCIQICNHITKPKMPVWFAILSTCSFPFYMHEQYSHKKWQVSQFPKTYPSFNQFSHKNNQSLIPNLIDQQINTYLNPQILEPFPLIYLTNPYFGLIKTKNAKILTISYKTINNQLTDRNRNKLFQESEINVNLSNIFSLYFNKNDKNLKILRHYLRKKFKETHFYSLFQALINKNVNLYQHYNKFDKQINNSQTSQEPRKCLSSLASFDEQGEQTNSQTKHYTHEDKQYVKNNKQIGNFSVKISKLEVERMQSFSGKGQIIDKGKIDKKNSYKFYKTFSQVERQRQYEIPQLSSKGLMIDIGENPQSHSFEKILIKGLQLKHQSKLPEEKPKRKEKRIRKMISKYIINCKCFGFLSDKGQNSIHKKSNL